MKKIIWLASYPKSGNTWFRVFLVNLFSDADTPADINRLGGTAIASARALFDDAAGVKASNLTAAEIDRLRPRVYEAWAEAAQEVTFRKIHDAYSYTSGGEPMVSAVATCGALYFIRNPLDVCVSYAHHSHCDVETALGWMADETHAFCDRPGRLPNQLQQHLSSWRGHVLSWIEAPEIDVHVVRYEDMKARPLETFTAAARFVGLDHTPEEIERALALSAFEVLQQQEAEHGFREKARQTESFFRKGEVGTWREVLTPDQVDRIIDTHGDVMRRFGYLSEDGPVLVL